MLIKELIEFNLLASEFFKLLVTLLDIRIDLALLLLHVDAVTVFGFKFAFECFKIACSILSLFGELSYPRIHSLYTGLGLGHFTPYVKEFLCLLINCAVQALPAELGFLICLIEFLLLFGNCFRLGLGIISLDEQLVSLHIVFFDLLGKFKLLLLGIFICRLTFPDLGFCLILTLRGDFLLGNEIVLLLSQVRQELPVVFDRIFEILALGKFSLMFFTKLEISILLLFYLLLELTLYGCRSADLLFCLCYLMNKKRDLEFLQFFVCLMIISCLAGLLFERSLTLIELIKDIIDPQKVLLRIGKLALGFILTHLILNDT